MSRAVHFYMIQYIISHMLHHLMWLQGNLVFLKQKVTVLLVGRRNVIWYPAEKPSSF